MDTLPIERVGYLLWLSQDATLEEKLDLILDFPPGTDPILEAPGTTNLVRLPYRIPIDLDVAFCGNMYLLCQIDPNNDVVEVDEKNNVLASVQNVRVTCPECK